MRLQVAAAGVHANINIPATQSALPGSHAALPLAAATHSVRGYVLPPQKAGTKPLMLGLSGCKGGTGGRWAMSPPSFKVLEISYLQLPAMTCQLPSRPIVPNVSVNGEDDITARTGVGAPSTGQRNKQVVMGLRSSGQPAVAGKQQLQGGQQYTQAQNETITMIM